MDSNFKLPTETVELPSKGYLYSQDSPLAKGEIEMKYMTAKEEDILTNTNYIRQGTVIDRLLRSLIVTEGVNFDEILIGDKNAIMLAARILSYGKDYDIKIQGITTTVDLSLIDNKPLHEEINTKGKNEFTFNLPHSGNVVTFKILSHIDELNIDKEVKGLKKLDKDSSSDVTTRLKHIITSINGKREQKDIREFVDNYLLAKDARALREKYSEISPDVDLKISYTAADGGEEEMLLPIGLDFFWPEL